MATAMYDPEAADQNWSQQFRVLSLPSHVPRAPHRNHSCRVSNLYHFYALSSTLLQPSFSPGARVSPSMRRRMHGYLLFSHVMPQTAAGSSRKYLLLRNVEADPTELREYRCVSRARVASIRLLLYAVRPNKHELQVLEAFLIFNKDQGFGDACETVAQDPRGRYAKELTRSAALLLFNKDESGGADTDFDAIVCMAELRMSSFEHYRARGGAVECPGGRGVMVSRLRYAPLIDDARRFAAHNPDICLFALSDGAFDALMQCAIVTFALQERNSLVTVSAFLLQPHIPHARHGRAIRRRGMVNGIALALFADP
ncbi:hypothetical protein FB451DRAFT_1389395 [Mycena latifolia]|nr:hypothetical protein FB451DRAFT_1389395 [Mycena latifolia]